MMGLELVVGYLTAYAVRKAHRVGRRLDDEVDRAIDDGLDKLHEIVSEKLGDDPAVLQLEREAEAGVENVRSSERVRLALEEAAETDPEFSRHIEEALARLKAAGAAPLAASVVHQVAVADHGSTISQAGRDVTQQTWYG
jgi:broad specificity phosphatase PhoE